MIINIILVMMRSYSLTRVAMERLKYIFDIAVFILY